MCFCTNRNSNQNFLHPIKSFMSSYIDNIQIKEKEETEIGREVKRESETGGGGYLKKKKLQSKREREKNI